jgi:hypothetical protein
MRPKSFSLLCAIVFAANVLFVPSSSAYQPSVRSVIATANAMSILGGLGLFTAATLDIIREQTNGTALNEPHTQVAATAMTLYAVGTVISIIASEMSNPQTLERVDELATAMTAVGFSLTGAGLWTSNTNALLAGSVTLSTFFAARGLLLPLIIEKHQTSFRPSDKYLLTALTFFGNGGGLLVVWSNLETLDYRRQILQAGLYVLGIINTIVFTGLTFNLYRLPKEIVSYHV